jgi:hypothetical protein
MLLPLTLSTEEKMEREEKAKVHGDNSPRK